MKDLSRFLKVSVEIPDNDIPSPEDISKQSVCVLPIIDNKIQSIREEILKKEEFFLEIPPIPWGYKYAVALTHDVDYLTFAERPLVSKGYAAMLSLRRGLYVDALKILTSFFGSYGNNLDLIMKIESMHGVKSTFFMIPRRGIPGLRAPPARAGTYDLPAKDIKYLTDNGWEVGVHGIDNWIQQSDGILEKREIASYARGVSVGNRTHWLMFSQDSLPLLDAAGYSYDTTVGYNETVGYKAGTVQVYQPDSCMNLMELPLHIQDVALFGEYCWEKNDWRDPKEEPTRKKCLHLSEPEASKKIDEILKYARDYGGVVTVLFHHELFGPPHKIGNFYDEFLTKVIKDGAWVTRARDIVEWFKNRDRIQIVTKKTDNGVHVRLVHYKNTKPPMRLRVHTRTGFRDILIDREELDVSI